MKHWSKYIPQGFSVDYIEMIISPYDVIIKVSKKRKTKLGDYRPKRKEFPHIITVNENSNVYSFLITLIHEIAHLVIWEQHKTKAKAHGEEWKKMFKELIAPCLNEAVFPSDLAHAVLKSSQNFKAAVHSDVALAKAIKKYDETAVDVVYIERLVELTKFEFGGRKFMLQHKVKKRYKCLELSTKKQYLFSPLAEVKVVEN